MLAFYVGHIKPASKATVNFSNVFLSNPLLYDHFGQRYGAASGLLNQLSQSQVLE